MDKKLKNLSISNGFTLLEVMVAVIILTFGILTVTQMTILGQNANTMIKEYMEGREVLARGMEVLKVLPINDPLLIGNCDTSSIHDTTMASDVGYYADLTNIVGRTIGYTEYRLYWNVADSFPNSDYKTIRIIVLNRNGRHLIDADYVRWR